MTSKYTKYRAKLKETDPAKYEEQLHKARERNKRNRDKRNEKWTAEPLTRSVQQEIDDFKAKRRERVRAHYSRKKAEKEQTTRQTSRSQINDISPGRSKSAKRPKDMTVEEYREHMRALRAESRKRRTPMKVFWDRRKNKESQQQKRSAQRKEKVLHVQSNPSPSQNLSPPQASPMKQAEYNLVSDLRKKLVSKTPGKFAKLMSNITKNTRRDCTDTQAALQREGLKATKGVHNVKHRKLQGRFSSARRRLFKERKRRKDALSDKARQKIGVFYMREDISRALPHKRYATKHGPGFVMQQTILSAHKIFQADHPDIKVGYTLFSRLKPKNVRKISGQFLETCQCVYCVNIRMKVLALNRTISSNGLNSHMRLQGERGVYRLLLCDKGEAAFNSATCVDGACSQCCDVDKTINTHYTELKTSNPTLSWTRWCRQTTGTVKEPVVKIAPVSELLEELMEDVKHPAKGATFLQHLFAADWQHHQLSALEGKPDQ